VLALRLFPRPSTFSVIIILDPTFTILSPWLNCGYAVRQTINTNCYNEGDFRCTFYNVQQCTGAGSNGLEPNFHLESCLVLLLILYKVCYYNSGVCTVLAR
jgi:hypothetical protein